MIIGYLTRVLWHLNRHLDFTKSRNVFCLCVYYMQALMQLIRSQIKTIMFLNNNFGPKQPKIPLAHTRRNKNYSITYCGPKMMLFVWNRCVSNFKGLKVCYTLRLHIRQDSYLLCKMFVVAYFWNFTKLAAMLNNNYCLSDPLLRLVKN